MTALAVGASKALKVGNGGVVTVRTSSPGYVTVVATPDGGAPVTTTMGPMPDRQIFGGVAFPNGGTVVITNNSVGTMEWSSTGGVSPLYADESEGAVSSRGDPISVGTVTIPFSASVPFATQGADMGIYYMGGPLTLTANTSGAVRNGGASLTVVGDGGNSPVMSGMVAHSSDMGYVVTEGVVNTLVTWYDGLRYYYQWSQDAAQSPIPGIAYTMLRMGTLAGTPAITEVANAVAGWDYYGTNAGTLMIGHNPGVATVASTDFEIRVTCTNVLTASNQINLVLADTNGAIPYNNAGAVYALNAGDVYRIYAGGALDTTGGASAAGHQIRIKRTGSSAGATATVTFDYSTDGGATWTNIRTLTNQSSSTRLYPNIRSLNTGRAFQPRAKGMAA